MYFSEYTYINQLYPILVCQWGLDLVLIPVLPLVLVLLLVLTAGRLLIGSPLPGDEGKLPRSGNTIAL